MSNKLQLIKILFMAGVCGMFFTGCCAPGVVRLTDKPFSGSQLAPNGHKVALIVRDERPGTIQKANMCGVNNQTAFHIPVAPIFLAHMEHLDSIVACHIKMRLEKAGYQVVSCYPKIKGSLSQEEVKASYFEDAKDAAWQDKDSQKISKTEKKAIKEIGKKGSIEKEQFDEVFVSPWGDILDVRDANAVVELKIKKFWTDYSYYGSVSWMSVNLAVCSADDELRKVFYGNKLKGGGYMFSFFTPLTPSSDATVSVNTAYWSVLNGFEKELASPGFLNTIKVNSSDQ